MTVETKASITMEEFIAAAKASVVTRKQFEELKTSLAEAELQFKQEEQAQYPGQEFMNRVYSL